MEIDGQQCMIIDFDTNDWLPFLHSALEAVVSETAKAVLRRSTFEYRDEALRRLVELVDREALVDLTLTWLRGNHVRAYHGTRLTDDEVGSIEASGLQPLDHEARIARLRKCLPGFDQVLTDDWVANAMAAGSLVHRQGQVHAAISRHEMLSGYDYLFEGSEFDRRLLEYGGRPDLVEVLTTRGKPRLIKIVLTGDEALEGMHPFFPLDFTRENDGYPNLVRQLLEVYAWYLHDPTAKRLGLDACFFYKRALGPEKIEGIETIGSR
jgi:hypothetical protein